MKHWVTVKQAAEGLRNFAKLCHKSLSPVELTKKKK